MRAVHLTLPALLALAAPPVIAAAEEPTSVDARFDRTGDGYVDAEDWRRMSEEERRAYARASVEALGIDPEAQLADGNTRVDHYLAGLRAAYE